MMTEIRNLIEVRKIIEIIAGVGVRAREKGVVTMRNIETKKKRRMTENVRKIRKRVEKVHPKKISALRKAANARDTILRLRPHHQGHQIHHLHLLLHRLDQLRREEKTKREQVLLNITEKN